MSDERREKITRLIEKMFDMVPPKEVTDQMKGDESQVDDAGVPIALRTLAEAVFAEDIHFYIPGHGPHAFSGVGHQPYFKFNAERMQATEGKLSLKLLDILIGETHAAALIHYREETAGKPFEWLRTNVFKFNDALDKIIEVRVFEHDQHGVDAYYTHAYGASAGR